MFRRPVGPTALVKALCAETGGLTEAQWRVHLPEIGYRETC
ncbi:hypothetical protein [Actinomadura sp. CNU-125]|nr:hypothetical protein [Actinomadura sp. CNU-125]